MNIYQKILNGVVKFPKGFDKYFFIRKAKSLVKHLLIADINKRYGSAQNGILDIK
jgi:hypothetical protein